MIILPFLLAVAVDPLIIPGAQWSAPRSFFFCAPKDPADGFWSFEIASSKDDQYLILHGRGPKYAPKDEVDITLKRPFRQVVYTEDNGRLKWVVEANGQSNGKQADVTLTLLREPDSKYSTAEFVVRTNGQSYSVNYCSLAPLPPSRRPAKVPQ